MKKALFILAALLAMPVLASAQEASVLGRQTSIDGVRVPSGYQGHIEYSNVFFLEDSKTGMSLSTTHGFFYSDNMFVGLGIGVLVAPEDTYVPVFASAKYIFNPYGKKVSPTIQMRMGSFFNDGAKPYLDGALGLRFASNHDFAFSILVGGSYLAPIEYCEWDYDRNGDYRVDVKRNLSCLSLRMGIEW